MLTPQALNEFVRATPFRPFRIFMASGSTFEIRHPEMIKVMKTNAMIFTSTDGDDQFPDRFTTISLMLSESVVAIDAMVS